MINVAVITPKEKKDYLVDTIMDGLHWRNKNEGDVAYKNSEKVSRNDFVKFAKEANLIILCHGKDDTTNFDLANEIDEWDKTVFVDGSELGRNRRFDKEIQREVETMTYVGKGMINKEMLKKCAIYFRMYKLLI